MNDLQIRFEDWLKDKGLKPSTIYDYISRINGICQVGCYGSWEHLARNTWILLAEYVFNDDKKNGLINIKNYSALIQFNTFLYDIEYKRRMPDNIKIDSNTDIDFLYKRLQSISGDINQLQLNRKNNFYALSKFDLEQIDRRIESKQDEYFNDICKLCKAPLNTLTKDQLKKRKQIESIIQKPVQKIKKYKIVYENGSVVFYRPGTTIGNGVIIRRLNTGAIKNIFEYVMTIKPNEWVHEKEFITEFPQAGQPSTYSNLRNIIPELKKDAKLNKTDTDIIDSFFEYNRNKIKFNSDPKYI